jgi:hypothetical protein
MKRPADFDLDLLIDLYKNSFSITEEGASIGGLCWLKMVSRNRWGYAQKGTGDDFCPKSKNVTLE